MPSILDKAYSTVSRARHSQLVLCRYACLFLWCCLRSSAYQLPGIALTPNMPSDEVQTTEKRWLKGRCMSPFPVSVSMRILVQVITPQPVTEIVYTEPPMPAGYFTAAFFEW